MRIKFCFILLALAGSVQAAGTDGVDRQLATDDARSGANPMAWRYRLLQTAQDVFEERAAAQAPGAALSFRLPKVDPAQAGSQVEIVRADKRIPLPMDSNVSFALVADAQAAQDDAMVVVNRNFRKGHVNHPLVQVRSPGLPEGVKRMGDLRLACEAQIAMAKAEGLKFRAMLVTASLFGLDVCDKLEVNDIDAPPGPYDTVTIEEGGRRLVQLATQENLTRLSDKDWSDNARISYTFNGQAVQ